MVDAKRTKAPRGSVSRLHQHKGIQNEDTESVIHGSPGRLQRTYAQRNLLAVNESSFIETDAQPLPTHLQVCPEELFNKAYKLDRKLGSGSFGDAFLTQWKGDDDAELSSKSFAAKKTSSHKVIETPAEELENELQVGSLWLPFNLHNRDVFVSQKRMLAIMPQAKGGELFGVIVKEDALSPKRTMRIGAQLALGLWLLHGHEWMSNDVKPENVLLFQEPKSGVPDKVTHMDYGFATKCSKQKPACGLKCHGTPEYVAPNLWKTCYQRKGQKTPYGVEVDWWAFHVTMFTIASGVDGSSLCNKCRQRTDFDFYTLRHVIPKGKPKDHSGNLLKKYLTEFFGTYFDGNFIETFHRSENWMDGIHDFNQIHTHPVMGNDFWLTDEELLNELGVDLKSGAKMAPGSDKAEVVKEFWSRICEEYAKDPCLCPHVCYKTCKDSKVNPFTPEIRKQRTSIRDLRKQVHFLKQGLGKRKGTPNRMRKKETIEEMRVLRAEIEDKETTLAAYEEAVPEEVFNATSQSCGHPSTECQGWEGYCATCCECNHGGRSSEAEVCKVCQ